MTKHGKAVPICRGQSGYNSSMNATDYQKQVQLKKFSVEQNKLQMDPAESINPSSQNTDAPQVPL